MMLVEGGVLDLEASPRAYLGDVWPRRLASARVRHLLSHSSGLANPVPIRWVHRAGEPRPDPREFLSRLLARRRAARFEPGARAAYSNVGYLALGEIIATVAACPYETFVRDALLRPLAMDRTAFTWHELRAVPVPPTTGYQRVPRALTPVVASVLPRGVIGARHGPYVALEPFELDGAAYGGLIGTVADAARLVALHCNRGTVDGTKLLDAESVAAMVSITTEGKPYDLGLGWFRPTGAPGGTRVEHLGGGMGFWNVMRVDPERRRGAVVMSNTTRHWPVAQLADSVMATLDG
jgi:CubicO group peptidase (beta-lactamase class C family)